MFYIKFCSIEPVAQSGIFPKGLGFLRLPLLFVLTLWGVKFIEYFGEVSFSEYGIIPLSFKGLRGIILAPFIHGDFEHLWANSVPLLVLGGLLFYFFRPIALQVCMWAWFMSCFWLWVIGRPSVHIGASMLIYALASFVFSAAVLTRIRVMFAISLLVVFLYGSLVWGLLPVDSSVSWEGHLSGFVAGIVLAFYHRRELRPAPAPLPQASPLPEYEPFIAADCSWQQVVWQYEYTEKESRSQSSG